MKRKIKIWGLVPKHWTPDVPASSTRFPLAEIEVSEVTFDHIKQYLPLDGDMFGATLEPEIRT